LRLCLAISGGLGMISALCWLPRGAANEVPQTTELTEEDLLALREAAGEADGAVLLPPATGPVGTRRS